MGSEVTADFPSTSGRFHFLIFCPIFSCGKHTPCFLKKANSIASLASSKQVQIYGQLIVSSEKLRRRLKKIYILNSPPGTLQKVWLQKS